MLMLMLFWLYWLLGWFWWCRFYEPRSFKRISLKSTVDNGLQCNKKADWVPEKIIHLKVLMPHDGCRKVADAFNRLYRENKGVSVSKSYVCTIIRAHQYDIQVLRRKMKHKRPRPVAMNHTWGLDLTGKTDLHGNTQRILGILDHGSRASLGLLGLKDKSSLTLLRCLLDAIEQYGKPIFIRTDNEAVFCSRLFRTGLWLLGIKHQRTELHCPWQNGRIERFFGTLKGKLNQLDVSDLLGLNQALDEYRLWYNHVRPHQHLDGRTPAEVWAGRDVFTSGYKQAHWFEAWEGMLVGYYLEPG